MTDTWGFMRGRTYTHTQQGLHQKELLSTSILNLRNVQIQNNEINKKEHVGWPRLGVCDPGL